MTAEEKGGVATVKITQTGDWSVHSTDGTFKADREFSWPGEMTIAYFPVASTAPQEGVSYVNGFTGIDPAYLKMYGQAVSDNAAITATTSVVYVDFGASHNKISVGDVLTLNYGGVGYDHVVLGFNHDELNDAAWYGAATATGKAGFSFQMRDCHTTAKRMNSSNTNSGGYDNTEMHKTTLPSLYNSMDEAIRNAIAPVKKKASAGSESSAIETITCNLWLLAEIEIFGSIAHSKSGEGSQYQWYRAGNTRVKTVNGSAANWWERSPFGSNSTYFCYVYSSGAASGNYASFASGVAPGLCI